MLRRDLLSGAASGIALFELTGTKNAMAAETMIARPIPSSGEAMPVIGLGTWQVFDAGADDRARQPGGRARGGGGGPGWGAVLKAAHRSRRADDRLLADVWPRRGS